MCLVLCGEVDDCVRIRFAFLRRLRGHEARRVQVLRLGLGRRGRLALRRRRRAAEQRVHEGDVILVVLVGLEILTAADGVGKKLLVEARLSGAGQADGDNYQALALHLAARA